MGKMFALTVLGLAMVSMGCNNNREDMSGSDPKKMSAAKAECKTTSCDKAAKAECDKDKAK